MQDILGRLEALRAELDQKHGEAWPSEAIEAYERATAEVQAQIEAYRKRAEQLERERELRAQAEQLMRVESKAARVMPVKADGIDEMRALRAFLANGTASPEALRYVQAAAPGVTGEGFLVSPQVSPTIATATRPSAVMRQYVSVQTTGSDSYIAPFVVPDVDEPSKDVKVKSTKGSEYIPGATIDAVQQLIERAKITLHTWTSNDVLVHPHVIADSQSDIEGTVLRLLADTWGVKEDRAIIKGTGNGEPLGVLSDAAVTVVNSGTNGQVTYNGLVDVMSAIKSAYASRGIWVMHRLAKAQLLKLADSQGRPLFTPGEQVTTLFGRPIIELDHVEAPANGAKSIIFGDFSQYILVDRQDRQIQRYTEIRRPFIAVNMMGRIGGLPFFSEAFAVLRLSA
jgi:HK97 family phage major capsid protein